MKKNVGADESSTPISSNLDIRQNASIETFCFAVRVVGFLFVCLLLFVTYDSLALCSSGFLYQLTQTPQRRGEESFLRK